MSKELSNKARLRIIGRTPDWIKKFEINEYVENPPMIEKLYEEKQLALATSIDLEDRVKDLSTRIHDLELDNQKLSMQLDTSKKQSFTVFALSLLAAILAGIGVNIATSQPQIWMGWTMIIVAVVLELLAFAVTYYKQV